MAESESPWVDIGGVGVGGKAAGRPWGFLVETALPGLYLCRDSLGGHPDHTIQWSAPGQAPLPQPLIRILNWLNRELIENRRKYSNMFIYIQYYRI
jgi:hypothetical protein